MKLLAILLIGWFWWLLFFLPGPINAATVSIAKDVIIGGPYGQVTVVNEAQIVNSFITYANGTMFFDVAGLEATQQFYEYRVRSYGNGTMLVKFSGLTPVSTNQAPLASYENGEQRFRFARDESGQLCVSYVRGFCPGLGGGILTLPNLLLVVAGIFLAAVAIVAVESRVRNRD